MNLATHLALHVLDTIKTALNVILVMTKFGRIVLIIIDAELMGKLVTLLLQLQEVF